MTQEELEGDIIEICMKHGFCYDYFVSEHAFLIKSIGVVKKVNGAYVKVENIRKTYVELDVTYYPVNIPYPLLEDLSKLLNTKEINIRSENGKIRTNRFITIISPIQLEHEDKKQ